VRSLRALLDRWVVAPWDRLTIRLYVVWLYVRCVWAEYRREGLI
jgi:hypothetical protein